MIAFYQLEGIWSRTGLPDDVADRLAAIITIWKLGVKPIVIDHSNGRAFIYDGRLEPIPYEGYQDWK